MPRSRLLLYGVKLPPWAGFLADLETAGSFYIVMESLQPAGQLDFTTLKKRLDVSDGAIAPHLRKLEDIGYLNCRKSFVGRRPKSTYRISAAGRKALANYLNAMQQLIDSMRGS